MIAQNKHNKYNQYSTITKVALAKKLGISRSSLYYKHKRPAIDEEIKRQIEAVMIDNPAYGHKRIALALKLNKKRILRVMKKFDIKPYRKRRTPRKRGDENKPNTVYSNLIQNIHPTTSDIVWVTDFTYIRYHERFIYLATIMDIYNREIVGWNISRFHNQELVLGALEHALSNVEHFTPSYLHSDQGSEYDSRAYATIVEKLNIRISMSRKSSPWENPYQESFYSQFKVDLGDPNRFETLGELIEAIHQTIYYYNHERIHTVLKMSPIKFRRQFETCCCDCRDSSSKKLGT
jgi:transposase InsO family protein